MQKRDRTLPACMKKKFYRYSDGAEQYGMSRYRFQNLAIEAKAVYKIDKVILVNTDILDDYLNLHGLTPEELDEPKEPDPIAKLEELEALKEQLTNIIQEERRKLCKEETEAWQRM